MSGAGDAGDVAMSGRKSDHGFRRETPGVRKVSSAAGLRRLTTEHSDGFVIRREDLFRGSCEEDGGRWAPVDIGAAQRNSRGSSVIGQREVEIGTRRDSSSGGRFSGGEDSSGSVDTSGWSSSTGSSTGSASSATATDNNSRITRTSTTTTTSLPNASCRDSALAHDFDRVLDEQLSASPAELGERRAEGVAFDMSASRAVARRRRAWAVAGSGFPVSAVGISGGLQGTTGTGPVAGGPRVGPAITAGVPEPTENVGGANLTGEFGDPVADADGGTRLAEALSSGSELDASGTGAGGASSDGFRDATSSDGSRSSSGVSPAPPARAADFLEQPEQESMVHGTSRRSRGSRRSRRGGVPGGLYVHSAGAARLSRMFAEGQLTDQDLSAQGQAVRQRNQRRDPRGRQRLQAEQDVSEESRWEVVVSDTAAEAPISAGECLCVAICVALFCVCLCAWCMDGCEHFWVGTSTSGVLREGRDVSATSGVGHSSPKGQTKGPARARDPVFSRSSELTSEVQPYSTGSGWVIARDCFGAFFMLFVIFLLFLRSEKVNPNEECG